MASAHVAVETPIPDYEGVFSLLVLQREEEVMMHKCERCDKRAECCPMCPECMEALCLACYGPDYEPGAWCRECIFWERMVVGGKGK